ncbi:hypothetical protein [Gordonia sp. N1V]|uniref:hypothetical protein n=1 Tax=Gordonia sp. N1V TaxID=3034163 RepID=UPI0023E18DCF|nr:hypothetical protein [Gordonia sp. N1V]MDF3280906.1 hypothetical protein [Gordonia sp. N1V]
MGKKKSDEATKDLAANLSRLPHPSGKTLRLVNYEGPGADRLRLDLAEAIMAFLRDRGYAK